MQNTCKRGVYNSYTPKFLVLFIGLAMMGVAGSANSALLTYTDRALWQAAAGGGTGDKYEDLNSVTVDDPYHIDPITVGFLTFSTDLAFDNSWRIDAPPDRFTSIPNVNGSTFATTLSTPSSNTILSFSSVGAIGFDFGSSSRPGMQFITTSLGDTTFYTNTTTTGGFFGILYDAGEKFSSLTWSATVSKVSSGIDNIEAFTTPAVTPAVIPVAIDIKPDGDPNAVNLKSKGVVPVAVLGSIDFDATQVVFSTVKFGPDGASTVHDGHVEDVNDDGFPDMVFHFKTQETGIACGDTDATLLGEIFGGGGTEFMGIDAVKTVGCKLDTELL